jgi:heme exporter protein CcmD
MKIRGFGMNDFFYMGGFGSYIWSAMSITAVLMILEPLMLVMRKKALIKVIKRNNQSVNRREQRRGDESANNRSIKK